MNLQQISLMDYLRKKRMGNQGPYDAGYNMGNQRKSFERYTSPGYRVGSPIGGGYGVNSNMTPYNKSQFGPGYNSKEMYTSPGYRVGSPMPYTNPQAAQAPWAQRQSPYQQTQQPYQQSQFGGPYDPGYNKQPMSQYLNREGAARAGNPTQYPQSPVSNVDNTTMRGDNLGGENLPPLDRNPYSPTQGQGFNLENMLRKNRPTYY